MLRISGDCRDFWFDLSAEDGKSRGLVEDPAGSRHETVPRQPTLILVSAQKILSPLGFFYIENRITLLVRGLSTCTGKRIVMSVATFKFLM